MSELICDSCGLKDYGEPGYCGRNLGDGYCCGTLQEPAPKRHRLSIEECVYWLMVVGVDRHARSVVELNVRDLQRWRAFYSARLRGHKNWTESGRRESGVLAFLLGEALRELGATKHPLSGKELAERYGFQPLKSEEYESNVDREARRALRTGGQP